jgi:hypothetical protein
MLANKAIAAYQQFRRQQSQHRTRLGVIAVHLFASEPVARTPVEVSL